MKVLIKRVATTTAAAGVLAVALPVAGAAADTPPAATPPTVQMPAMNFVPPKVGQISVDIGPTIIGGKVMDPGMHVTLPGTSLPPITLSATSFTLPASSFTLPPLG
jgi:hypothetical protein